MAGGNQRVLADTVVKGIGDAGCFERALRVAERSAGYRGMFAGDDEAAAAQLRKPAGVGVHGSVAPHEPHGHIHFKWHGVSTALRELCLKLYRTARRFSNRRDAQRIYALDSNQEQISRRICMKPS